MAGDRGFAFPTSFGQIPTGDAIVFMTPERMVPGLERPITGPTAAMIRNPNDPYSTLLLVMGRDANELKQAATGLAYAQGSLKGESIDLTGSTAPVYGPNKAPRWLPTDRKVPLGEIAEAKALTGMGLQPGNLPAPFRLAPDLFFWPAEGGKLKTEYQYPRGEWLDRARSRLDVTLNGQYIRSLPLQDRTWFERLTGTKETASAEATAKMSLPAYALFGENLLGFNYDLQITDPGECVGQLPNNVLTSIKTTSYVDFRGGHHAARMPNLALFTGGGFPWTRMADLGQTAVLVSAQPTVGEVEGFLNLMGQFGDSTGAAATGVQVTRTLQASRLKDKDILVVGKADLAQNRELFGKAPVRMTNARLEVVRQSPLERFFGWFSPEKKDDARDVSQAVSAANGFEGIASFRSPYDGDRHVVAVLTSQPDALPQLTQLLPLADAKAQIRGDLILKTGSEFKAYQIQSTQWRGNLPWWLAIGYWFSQRPLVLALAALLSAALIGFPLYYSLKAQGRRRLKGEKHD
jgi:cellulose synthase (UDP-forming)